MAFSYTEQTGDGVTTVFPFSFAGAGTGYIREDDIKVFVDGVETNDFIFSGTNQIQFNTAPPAPVAPWVGPNIMIRRVMPKDRPYADFSRGNNFGQEQMNYTVLQQLYVLHETLDGFFPDGYFVKGDMDLKGNRLLNVGSPINPSDAVPLSFVATDLPLLVEGATVSAGTAVTAAGEAAASASSASASAASALAAKLSVILDTEYNTLAEADAAAVAAGKSLLISKQWVMPLALTLNAHVCVMRGADLVGPGAVNFNGGVEAGRFQFISGGLSVVFARGTMSEVLPEWWGAKADGLYASRYTNTAAIHAALATKLPVQLTRGSYHHTGIIIGDYQELRGCGSIDASLLYNWTAAPSITFQGVGGKLRDVGLKGDVVITGDTYTGVTTDGIFFDGASGEGDNLGCQLVLVQDVRVDLHGGHGITFSDGCWIIDIERTVCTSNGKDGFNIDNTKGNAAYTDQKNLINLTACGSHNNKRNGFFLVGLGISLFNCDAERNKGAGISMDMTLCDNLTVSTQAMRINIRGGYVEKNEWGAVYIKTGQYGGVARVLKDCTIEGVYFSQVQSGTTNHFAPGYTAVIYNTSEGTGVYNSNTRSLVIKDNSYGGVTLEDTATYSIFNGGNRLTKSSRIRVPTDSTVYAPLFKNMGNAVVEGLEAKLSINGFFYAKGATYTSVGLSDNVPSGTSVKFPFPLRPNDVVQRIGVYVDTDSTNYTVLIRLWGRDGTTNAAFVLTVWQYDITSGMTGKSGSQFVEMNGPGTESSSWSERIQPSMNDLYLEIVVTRAVEGTFLKLGDPVITFFPG